MKKLVTIGIIILVVIVIAAFWILSRISQRVSAPTNPTGTATSSARTMITGQVLLGPTCPVEHNPPLPGCEPKPYETTVDIRPASSSSSYMALNTDSSGIFKIALLPGIYYFNAQTQTGMPYPRCSPVQVAVVLGLPQNIIINCDTGIR